MERRVKPIKKLSGWIFCPLNVPQQSDRVGNKPASMRYEFNEMRVQLTMQGGQREMRSGFNSQATEP